jgi:hypothetical protein
VKLQTCRVCNVPKPFAEFSPDANRRTPSGRKMRARNCKQCEAARWRKYYASLPECPGCGKKKPRKTGYYRWTDNGSPRKSRLCKTCIRQAQRERHERIMADPYLAGRERARKNTWEGRQRRAEANPDRCRRYRERLKAERPDVYQQQLEDARIRNRQRYDNRQAPTTTKRAKVHQPRVHVPAEALVRFLDRFPDEAFLDESDTRAAFRARHEGDNVSVGVADRLITTLGGNLADVYPDLYA